LHAAVFGDIVPALFGRLSMRKFAFLAIAAALAAAAPSLAQVVVTIPASADRWVDNPQLAPALTDPEMRARMNAEIVQAIISADGDQQAARQAILVIAARYQELATPQGARTRPGPK
jgi:hypothetical protein